MSASFLGIHPGVTCGEAPAGRIEGPASSGKIFGPHRLRKSAGGAAKR
jgi:hypothetical protein